MACTERTGRVRAIDERPAKRPVILRNMSKVSPTLRQQQKNGNWSKKYLDIKLLGLSN